MRPWIPAASREALAEPASPSSCKPCSAPGPQLARSAVHRPPGRRLRAAGRAVRCRRARSPIRPWRSTKWGLGQRPPNGPWSQRLGEQIGWPPGQFAGLVTHGGSLANLTALLTARNVTLGDAGSRAPAGAGPPPVLVVHADAHYSVARAAGILGLGTEQRDPRGPGRRPPHGSPAVGRDARASCGRRSQPIVAVVACACSTPIGAFDPLDDVADVCRRHGVWLHVDAAHGGAACLSPRHRHLVAGLDRADSLVWDAHKMLFVPALCAFVFYRQRGPRVRGVPSGRALPVRSGGAGAGRVRQRLADHRMHEAGGRLRPVGPVVAVRPAAFRRHGGHHLRHGPDLLRKASAAADFVPLHEPQVQHRGLSPRARAPPRRPAGCPRAVPVGDSPPGDRIGRVLHRFHEDRRRGGLAGHDHQSPDHGGTF